jgi:hypothetical protein
MAKDFARVIDNVADVMILAMQIASHIDADAYSAIEEKHRINVGRSFRFDPALGYDKHVEEES